MVEKSRIQTRNIKQFDLYNKFCEDVDGKILPDFFSGLSLFFILVVCAYLLAQMFAPVELVELGGVYLFLNVIETQMSFEAGFLLGLVAFLVEVLRFCYLNVILFTSYQSRSPRFVLKLSPMISSMVSTIRSTLGVYVFAVVSHFFIELIFEYNVDYMVLFFLFPTVGFYALAYNWLNRWLCRVKGSPEKALRAIPLVVVKVLFIFGFMFLSVPEIFKWLASNFDAM
jgi:hypothetical protein